MPSRHRSRVACATVVESREMLVDLGCLRVSSLELDGALVEAMLLLLAFLDCRQVFPLTGRLDKGTSSTISTTSSSSSSSVSLLFDHEICTLDDFSASNGVGVS